MSAANKGTVVNTFMRKKLLNYLKAVCVGKRNNYFDRFIRVMLLLLEYIYFIIIKLREFLYKPGIFKTRELATRVICVGNITAGGTGKTSIVEKLAPILYERGKEPVIICSGYGGRGDTPLVVSDGKDTLVTRRECGDEAFMLAEHLENIPIIAGKDRYQAGLLAEEKFSPDIILLDDGFQHFQLKRDVDVLAIDAMNPFGLRHLIPRGYLREPLSALKRASAIIITHTARVSDKKVVDIKKELKEYNDDLRIFTSRHTSGYLRGLAGTKADKISVKELKGKKVFAFSGIGNPKSFIEELEVLGAEVVEYKFFPDHYEYDEDELFDISVRCQMDDIDMVVTTEKDMVKFTPEMLGYFDKSGTVFYSLCIELEFVGDISLLLNIIT